MTGCGWSAPVGGLHPALQDPWEAALNMESAVIALLVGTDGPAYRNPGAAMAIAPDGRCAGAITSGCVEADLVLQAGDLRPGEVRRLRYGAGSPYFDLKLPCGGAVEVMLFALRDGPVLAELSAKRAARVPVALRVTGQGRLALCAPAETGAGPEGFVLNFRPGLRFVIAGAGPEALVFTRLVAGMGHDHLLLSHDAATLASAQAVGCRAVELSRLGALADLPIDAETAVTLFYHDHDYEPGILAHLLRTPAFYIGAQGSRGAQRNRLARLAEMGVSAQDAARLRGPIGLIPSARDAEVLAVSVLAEIFAAHEARVRVPA